MKHGKVVIVSLKHIQIATGNLKGESSGMASGYGACGRRRANDEVTLLASGN